MSGRTAKSGRHLLGDFEVKSGKLVVSDPCYDRNTWCAGILSNVKNGKWHAAVELVDEGAWGVRVASLKVWKTEMLEPIPNEQVKFTIGVDAGQVCIVDDDVYPKGKTGEYGDLNTFYGRACKASYDERNPGHPGAGLIENNRGVNSSSGYGDGSYEGFVARDKDGSIVAVEVIFIDDSDGVEEETIEDEDDSGVEKEII